MRRPWHASIWHRSKCVHWLGCVAVEVVLEPGDGALYRGTYEQYAKVDFLPLFVSMLSLLAETLLLNGQTLMLNDPSNNLPALVPTTKREPY
jgi:hypothetical protein